jgi:NADH:ubiquinone oxidoreductase subunit 5 (subunit L)/multisubunit Na+/H+ antiporter MnhA subunit
MFPLAGGAGAPQTVGGGGLDRRHLHALAHAPAKAAMFLTAGMMMQAVGHDRLDGLVGMARELPMAAFAFALAAVSLMGLPPSGGFTAKYLLLTSAIASGQWWWVAVILAGGLLAAAYLFRVLNRFLSEPQAPAVLAPVASRDQIIAICLAGVPSCSGCSRSWPPTTCCRSGVRRPRWRGCDDQAMPVLVLSTSLVTAWSSSSSARPSTGREPRST